MFGFGKDQIFPCMILPNILLISEMLDTIILFTSNLMITYAHSTNTYSVM